MMTNAEAMYNAGHFPSDEYINEYDAKRAAEYKAEMERIAPKPQVNECDDSECEIDGGRIKIKREYDPEIGTELIVSFDYCKCERGQEAEAQDQRDEDEMVKAEELRIERGFEARW